MRGTVFFLWILFLALPGAYAAPFEYAQAWNSGATGTASDGSIVDHCSNQRAAAQGGDEALFDLKGRDASVGCVRGETWVECLRRLQNQ